MNIRNSFLRLALFPVLLLSASGYAALIFPLNLTGVAGEAYFSEYNDFGMDHPQADRMLLFLSPSWRGNTDRYDLLSGNYVNGFALPYGLNSVFATPLPDPDLGRAILSMLAVEATGADSGILSANHADEVEEFLAALGIVMADWQATEEDSFAAGQRDSSAPELFAPTTGRQESRNECLQRYYRPLQKHGLRENSCPEAGGMAGGAGGKGGLRSRGGLGAIVGGTGSGFGPGPASGIGSGGPGGPGIGGGDSVGPSGPGTSGGDSSGPGNGNGNDGVGGGGSGDIGDVRTVPEPTTLALIGFGIAGMCTARKRRK